MKRNLLAALVWVAFSLPALAADRQFLSTRVPASASNLPMLERMPATNRLQMAVVLPFHNPDALTNLLRQLYDSHSTNFHRYLKPDQFVERFGPDERDYQRVKDFARSNGLELAGTYGNRLVLDISGSAVDFEKTFQVRFGYYQHPTENRKFYAPDAPPSVDAGLPINFVSGLDNFHLPHPMIRKAVPLHADDHHGAHQTANLGQGTGTNGWYLGNDLRNAYVPNVNPSLTGTGQIVGLVELTGYNASDIQKYENLASLPNVTLTNILTNGVTGHPGTSDVDNGEVALDIEMAIAMAPGLKAVEVVEGRSDVDIMNIFAYQTNPDLFANQVSSSYAPYPDYIPPLIEMAAQGQSVFFASGDDGAPTSGTNTLGCYNYCTMVGGTELYMTNAATDWQAETVWNGQYILGQSAGFITPGTVIPEYQKGVNMSAVGGSTQWRNSPDVAMCADYLEEVYTIVNTNGVVLQTGAVIHVGGTSAAAPLWAAFTALVNQQAATQGKPTVGFLNPALYEIGLGPNYTNCFHDITVGNNTNSASSNLFFAAPGYDLCTGWGSPNGVNLINTLVNSYADPVFVDFNYTGSLATNPGSFFAPWPTLGQGVSAVPTNGTIFIINGGSSAETMTIKKPMTITAQDGSASVGN